MTGWNALFQLRLVSRSHSSCFAISALVNSNCRMHVVRFLDENRLL